MGRTLAVVAVMFLHLLASPTRSDDSASLGDVIDRHVEARLTLDKVQRVPQADDAEFLRRVFLDLHGVVPKPEEVVRFLDETDPDKRSRLIDELLDSPQFGEYFGDIWRKSLLSPLVNEERTRTERFAGWMAGRFNANDGWDRIAYDLLTATGKMEDNPAVTYLIEGRNPLGVTDLTDLTSRYFLGVRINCAQCHDHPFVEWKQQDYWGMAAFFTQIQTPRRAKQVYMLGVQDDPTLTLATLAGSDMLDGFQDRPPTFLGGEKSSADAEKPYRVRLARWMTSAENPHFAKAAVNRLWWHFLGRGIVTPVDDMHDGNPPSHPELLDALTADFAKSGFNLKRLCRAIVSSRTYQQTSRPGEQADAEAKVFARMSVKSLTPEQLYDSLETILGPPAKTPGITARFGARHEFCQSFSAEGDPEPTRYDRGIPHALRLMNSPQFAGRSLHALVNRLSSAGRSGEEIVEALFLTILARRPTPAEQQMVTEHLKDADGTPQAAYRELAWALLMSSEFALNH